MRKCRIGCRSCVAWCRPAFLGCDDKVLVRFANALQIHYRPVVFWCGVRHGPCEARRAPPWSICIEDRGTEQQKTRSCRASLQALRGRLWQAFLCLDSKREAGMYDQLVQKALGNTKYGRKVGLPRINMLASKGQ